MKIVFQINSRAWKFLTMKKVDKGFVTCQLRFSTKLQELRAHWESVPVILSQQRSGFLRTVGLVIMVLQQALMSRLVDVGQLDELPCEWSPNKKP